MSVLIVTPDIVGPVRNGGIGTACFHYARALVSAGIETSILYTMPLDAAEGARWKADYARRGIAFFTLADLPATSWKCHSFGPADGRSHAIYRFLRDRPYRYVIFQDWHGNGFWSMRAKRMGLALRDTTLGVIAHAPSEWQREGMASFGFDPLLEASVEWQEREAIAAADVLVSPSRHMVGWLTAHGYELPSDVTICPPTFEDPVADLAPGAVDKQHLIFFGRLETRKGLHLFAGALRALALEGRKLPRKVTLLGRHAPVAGTTSEAYLQALAEDVPGIEYAIESNLDYAAALALIRRERGVLVMPSTLDNFPLTIVEAIANRFAFITSTAGGIPEAAAPEALFAPTVTALKDKLAELPGMDFSALRHPYSIADARRTWLDHVRGILSAPPAAPHVVRADGDGVSVCIPFYHFDRYLPRLVSAFLKDRDPNLQLVFVNDGTPEAACPTFHRYARALEPIGHVFATQENAGAGAARNRAGSLARHRRLIFFDADNVPFPDLVPALRGAQASTGADSIAAPFLAVPPFARQPLPSDVLYAYLPPGGPFAASLHANLLGDTCSIQRRDVFEKLGGFAEDRGYFDDWEYYLRLIAHGYRHLVLPDPAFYYAYDPGGRRSESSLADKFSKLWGSLGGLPADRLAEIVALQARHHRVVEERKAGRR